jgi:hypothetical protein
VLCRPFSCWRRFTYIRSAKRSLTSWIPSAAIGAIHLRSRRFYTIALTIAVAVLALRLPVMFRQHAAQDEDYFAVPGWTILKDGVPRIPYLPSRDPKCLFYGADEGLFILPPLFHYWEAAVFSILGPSTGAGRLASSLAGVASILLLAAIARRLLKNDFAAILAASLYAFSRCAYFPWLMARPDTLCAFWGFAALATSLGLVVHCNIRKPILTGAFCGLGALTHPFAIVYAIQCAAITSATPGTWPSRLKRITLFGVSTAAIFALWLPSILQHRELFERQFVRSVIDHAGPGLFSRLIWPVPSAMAQWKIFLEHVGPWQAALMIGGVIVATLIAIRHHEARATAWVALSGLYLHVAVAGTHPTKGYWCYTGGLLWIAVACTAQWLAKAIASRMGRPRFANAGVALSLFALLIPGCGLRTLIAHLRHWDDPNYNSPKFIATLVENVTPDEMIAVDPAYVFEFWLRHPKTLLALEYEPFFRISQHRFDRMVTGEFAERDEVPQAVRAVFLKTIGEPNDPFACFAKIYSSQQATPAP